MAIKIYTAGKMSGIPFEEQMKWREEFEYKLKQYSDCEISFIHPPLYYNYDYINHKTEAEIKEWELNQLRKCDIVIVNLKEIDTSVGTHFELAFVNAMNMFGDKHIFVVGIGEEENIHPWIKLSLFRQEPDLNSACQYIIEYLLI